MDYPSAPPPSYGEVTSQRPDLPESNVREVAANFDIETKYAEHLKKLQYYEIIIILDDSGSMIAPTSGNQTRWDEAYRMLNIIANVLWQLKGEDTVIRVLNRPEFSRTSEILSIWPTIKPSGPTPIRAAFQSLAFGNEVPSLIFLITDGEPTVVRRLPDGRLENNVDNGFYQFIQDFQLSHQKVFLNVILCTSCDSVVKFWKRIDNLPRVDIIDDYETEQRKARGGMTFGTYVAKAMLGSIVPELDNDAEDDECCRIL